MPGSIKSSTKPVRRNSGKARFNFTPRYCVHEGSIYLFVQVPPNSLKNGEGNAFLHIT